MLESNSSRLPCLRILSGGQTGVDRAALDAASACGLPHGGWCPRGRVSEDGPIPERYLLTETASPGYRERTRRNIMEACATLILNLGPLSSGTALTRQLARKEGKPCLVVNLGAPQPPEFVRAWIASHAVAGLNVAGPSESKRPGIHDLALDYLTRVLGDG